MLFNPGGGGSGMLCVMGASPQHIGLEHWLGPAQPTYPATDPTWAGGGLLNTSPEAFRRMARVMAVVIQDGGGGWTLPMRLPMCPPSLVALAPVPGFRGALGFPAAPPVPLRLRSPFVATGVLAGSDGSLSCPVDGGGSNDLASP